MKLHHEVEGRVEVNKSITCLRLCNCMPFTIECLDPVAQLRYLGKVCGNARTLRDIAEGIMEVEQTKDSPVESRIPDDLRYHDLGLIHQGVLFFIDVYPYTCEIQEKPVVDRSSPLDVFPF